MLLPQGMSMQNPRHAQRASTWSRPSTAETMPPMATILPRDHLPTTAESPHPAPRHNTSPATAQTPTPPAKPQQTTSRTTATSNHLASQKSPAPNVPPRPAPPRRTPRAAAPASGARQIRPRLLQAHDRIPLGRRAEPQPVEMPTAPTTCAAASRVLSAPR